jgi:hypothetical protein
MAFEKHRTWLRAEPLVAKGGDAAAPDIHGPVICTPLALAQHHTSLAAQDRG